MLRKATLNTIEFHEGTYNDKPYCTAYLNYIDEFGPHREKVIDDIEYINQVAKEWGHNAYRWKYKDGRTIETYFFNGEHIKVDTIRNKFKEGQYVVTKLYIGVEE